jgi:hypothetical protein
VFIYNTKIHLRVEKYVQRGLKHDKFILRKIICIQIIQITDIKFKNTVTLSHKLNRILEMVSQNCNTTLAMDQLQKLSWTKGQWLFIKILHNGYSCPNCWSKETSEMRKMGHTDFMIIYMYVSLTELGHASSFFADVHGPSFIHLYLFILDWYEPCFYDMTQIKQVSTFIICVY